MSTRCLPLFFALIASLFLGCTKTYKLTSFPSGEVEAGTSLQFQFEDSIAPSTAIGKWDTTAFLTFDPPMKGSFRWELNNLLVFVCDQGHLPANTGFVAKPTSALFFGRSGHISPSRFEFHTPYFTAESLQASWPDAGRTNEEAPITLNLTFNYPVDEAEVKKHVELYRAGKRIEDISFFNYYSTTDFEIHADLGGYGPGPHPLEMRVTPGLKCMESDRPLAEEVVVRDTLQPISIVEIQTVGEEFAKGTYQMRVTSNQNLDSKLVAPFISLVPNMPFDLQNEGNELVIVSDFRPGAMYTIGFRAGMPGLAGGTLPEDYSTQITTPDLQPFLRFTDDKGHFLMRNGYEQLSVSTVNLDQFTVTLWEVYENNLMKFLATNPSDLRRGTRWEMEEEDDFYADNGGYLDIEEYGARIHTDTVQVPEGKENQIVSVPVKLQKQFRNKFQGIYAIQIESDNGHSNFSDYKIVSLSDLGLIARRNADDLIVFANHLSTARPAAGAKINLISTTNQVFRTATTDAQGVAKFEGVADEWDYDKTFRLSIVTAQLGNDFQFLDLHRTEVDQDRFDLTGKSRSAYDVFCYGDRDLYRPGDTMHFSAIVRKWDFSTPKDLPLTANVYGPEGGLVKEMQMSTNDDGSIELHFPIDDRARTGNYRVDVKAGLEEYYGQYEFTVEQFVPDNIKVRLAATRASGRPGDTLRFPLEAGYYFGYPCADHPYSILYKMRFVDYLSARFPTYNFAMRGSEAGAYDWETGEGVLDSAGRDTMEYIIPADLSGTGLATGLAQATVSDLSGHEVTAQKTFSIATRAHFLGIQEHGRYFNVGEQYQLDYVAVDYADQIAKSLKMEVKLVRFDWKRAMRRDDDGFFYVSESQSIPVKIDTVVQGTGSQRFSMPITQAGNYELSITMLDGSGSQRMQFSAYGKSALTATSFGVDREGTVAIQTDKQAYKVGENARILLTAPFSGRMLVTLERDKVYEYRYVDCENNAAEVVFPIKEGHVPNIFVTATLIRPHKGKGSLPMTVAHGYSVVKVDQPSRILPVKITAPERIKPGRTQTVTIQTAAKPGVKVTVAVVDEGILSIKHYRTPDAYSYFYAPRGLEVRGFDLYHALLPEVATGGSDNGDWSGYGQLNPVKSKRYKPFSWWSGIKETNGAGKVTVEVPIPESFNGRARIMVMAYDGTGFGSGEQAMIIREDLVLIAALPRFLTAGDSLQLPVSLINMTEKPGKAKVKLKVEGSLGIKGPQVRDLDLGAEQEVETAFAIHALKAGDAAIVLETEGVDKIKQRIEIPVRPPSTLIKESGNGVVTAGQSVAIQIPAGMEPELQRTLLTVSKFPALEFAGELDYLLHYPYGCLEQTVSGVFPQLYFGDLAELIAPDRYKGSNAVHNVRAGIEKIQGMQLYNGGFSYWGDGPGYENTWASVYATHFLLEARKAGFAVQEQVMERAIGHLAYLATGDATVTHIVNRGGNWYQQEKASQEQIYALYVLALADKADEAQMNYYKSHPNLLCDDSRYLLAAAFAHHHDLASFEALLPASMPTDIPARRSGGSFDSPMRATGVMLDALVEADPTNPRIPGLIKVLRQNRQHLDNTQEKAWAFLALGKVAKGQQLGDVSVRGTVDGKEVLVFDGSNTRHEAEDWSGKTIVLKAIGKGQAFYYWKMEGIPKGANVRIQDRDQQLQVRKEWYDTQGRKIKNPIFEQGEVVVCRVHVRAATDVENVAISDVIPAGFEIENSRLSSRDYSWIQQLDDEDISNQDIRDDRVNIFCNLAANEPRDFHYLVRAVNAGKFLMPPIAAEAMYDPAICSYRSGAVVYVLPKGTAVPGRPHDAPTRSSVAAAQPAKANSDQGTIWQRFMRSIQP